MKEGVLKIVEDLRSLAEHLESLSDLFKEENADSKMKANQKKSKEKITEEVMEKAISIEDVRAVLISKSQGGKQKEIKDLIQKYGADKLTDLDTSCYKDLLKDAEEIWELSMIDDQLSMEDEKLSVFLRL